MFVTCPIWRMCCILERGSTQSPEGHLSYGKGQIPDVNQVEWALVCGFPIYQASAQVSWPSSE